jgi:hypothetical protein
MKYEKWVSVDEQEKWQEVNQDELSTGCYKDFDILPSGVPRSP